MGIRYLNSSSGQPSASLTMAMLSFVLTTAWLVFWVVGTTFGLHVPQFEATVAMGYMGPLLGLYFGRRWTEKDSSDGSVVESSESEDIISSDSVSDDAEEEAVETDAAPPSTADTDDDEEETQETPPKSTPPKKKKTKR